MPLVTRRYRFLGASNEELGDEVGSDAAIETAYAKPYIDVEVDDSTSGIEATLDEFMAQRGWTFDASWSFAFRTRAGIVDNTALSRDDEYVAVGAGLSQAITLTLPLANSAPPGKPYFIKDPHGAITLTNTVTIARSGSDTIDGAASIVLNVAFQGRILISDGVSTWGVLGSIL